MLDLKPKGQCRWDAVALGEVMLRFDPGDDRIHTTRSFRVWEGGGEYNVIRNLSRCFRMRTSVVTAFADNQIGRLGEDLILQGGVDIGNIIWRETDGISRKVRNGMYFMERGFGIRPPTGCSDRGNTAISQLKPGDIDWRQLFGEQGTRWFHTGGIYAALSDTAPQVAAEAMQAARESGAIVSYDLNYRESLWSGRGGRDAANEVNRRLLDKADVVFGVEDFRAGFSSHSPDDFAAASRRMTERHPTIKAVVTSLRDIASASSHDIGGALFIDGNPYQSRGLSNTAVLDRVGSGDAFAAGLIFGLMDSRGPQQAIDIAAANAAFAMACPGDASSATLKDIERMLETGDAAAVR